MVVGSGVKTLDSYAFYGCDKLTDIFYKGNESAFKAVTVGGNNEPFEEATVYFYSETTPSEEGNFWYYKDGVVTKYE